MKVFVPTELKKLYRPASDTNGEDNGSITIIGGSDLFHGAPLFALKTASRIVDMVFFSSPEPSVGKVAENIKSELLSFIWVPWEEVDQYIKKSDAVLIGPGFKRFNSESTPHGDRIHNCDEECQKTREITKSFLDKFPNKKWVIDAGSLQTMDAKWIPKKAVITPNKKEYQLLFGDKMLDVSSETGNEIIGSIAKKHDFTIVLKGPETLVVSPDEAVLVKGGNPGLTKGGTGDVLAGLTVALLAKNDPFLAASSASYIEKKAADELYEKVGVNYNADDLVDQIPVTFCTLVK